MGSLSAGLISLEGYNLRLMSVVVVVFVVLVIDIVSDIYATVYSGKVS